MGAKKDFSKVNTKPIYNTIAEAIGEEQLPGQYVMDTEGKITEEPKKGSKGRKDRKTYTAKEKAEALESMQTSGKKGVKLPRINLAFSPANYDFVKVMAQVRGQSYTEFVNEILQEAREKHKDTYNKALEFRNSL